MNNRDVAHRWAHGSSGKGSNLTTDGVTLTSYSTTIAARIGDIIYISSDGMSPTTARHLSYARQAVSHLHDNIFYTPAFSWSGCNPSLTHEAMILPAVDDAQKTLNYALENSRTRKQTKINAVIEYTARRANILDFAERTGVAVVMLEYVASADVIAEYQERKEAARLIAEAARIKAQKKQQRQDKAQFKIWLESGAGSCPNSFRERNNDLITIAGHRTDAEGNVLKQGQIVTSQGATCPLDHAVKALRFWSSRLNSPFGKKFEPYHTNGHKIPLGVFTLDSIDEAGTVKAGCHTFTAKEIQRFINQWKEVLGL